jgi:hypothetical protein
MVITDDTLKAWAVELGIRIPRYSKGECPDLWQCWVDRVLQAGYSGRQEHIDEANRYA